MSIWLIDISPPDFSLDLFENRPTTDTLSPNTKMDFVKNLTGGKKEGEQATQGQAENTSGGGGFMDKLNNAAGGGAAGEKKEDGLDKGS